MATSPSTSVDRNKADGVLPNQIEAEADNDPPAGAPDSQNNIPRDSRVDLNCVYRYFHACIRQNDQIDVDDYISAYQELNRLFELLGKVFHFVASDVRSKLDIMVSLRKSEGAGHYATIQSMVAYEKENNLFDRKDPVSGSRTLLRLHRALAFIADLLDRLSKLEDDEKIAYHAQEAYRSTLAVHHPWLIQKMAIVAMYSLPTRKGLLATTCQDEQVGSQLLPQVVEVTKKVYDITQQIYTDNDILDLP